MKNILTALFLFICLSVKAQITPTPITSPRIAFDYFIFQDTTIWGSWAYPFTGSPVVNLRILPGALPTDNTDTKVLSFDAITHNVSLRDAGLLLTTVNSPLSLSSGTLSLLYQMSITSDVSGLKLVNDQTSPGNNYIYATNSIGVKGWRRLKKADFDDLDATEVVFGAWDASGNAQTSDNLTFNTSSYLYLNGRMGIGVTSPLEQLHITGNFRFPSTTSTTGIFYKDGTRILHFYGNNNIFLGGNSGNFTTSAGLFNGSNIGIGVNTLNLVSTGYFNTVMGSNSGQAVTTGFGNTYIGFQNGRNQTGSSNTALGSDALYGTAGLSTGSENVAIGKISGNLLTTGSRNTFLGYQSGETNTTGDNNIFIGYATGNTVPTVTGSNNILLGYNINLPTGSTNYYMSIGDIFKGDISTGVLTIPTDPTDDNSNTKILSRDAVTGNIEEMDASAIVDADASATNEGSLTVNAGSGSTSVISSNTSGSTDVTIAVAGINTIGEAGNTITITGTEVDGSTSNELQTLANTSDATSHTVTLSNSGGSVKLTEGSNISLTTTGTSSDGVVAVAVTGIGSTIQAYDADLDDLADGSLTGSKVANIPNSSLTNSSITFDGVSTSLGGSVTSTGFTIVITGSQGTIADATTYYSGAIIAGVGTTADVNNIPIPVNCVLKSVYVNVLTAGTLATTETSTWAIRKNNTTDITISSTVQNSAQKTNFNVTGLSTSFTAGDYVEAKWTTPTWVTNPSNSRWTIILYFEKV